MAGGYGHARSWQTVRREKVDTTVEDGLGRLPTMRDVAARAGVSAKTVSNVLRGWPPVQDTTRERVQQALDTMGYRLNKSPKMLRSGRSGMVALAVPWLDSPYFAELTSQIVRRADGFGLMVLIDQTDGLREKELIAVQGLRGQPIDGLIFSPHALGDEDLRVNRVVVPTVFLGERLGTWAGDHVAIDNVAAAVEIVTHLINLGRTRIAAIGHQSITGAVNARQRARGYELALLAAGHRIDHALQVTVEGFERAEGAAAMDRLLDSGPPPDAVFCFSDLLALGAMRTAQHRGYRVPQDIAIAGFDDIEDGRYANPPLTTIAPAKGQIAQVVLQLLSERLNGSREPPRNITATYKLLIRESTAGADTLRQDPELSPDGEHFPDTPDALTPLRLATQAAEGTR